MNSNTLRNALQWLPLTLAVALGPFIGVVFRLTQPTGAEIGGFSLTQVLRGLLCVLMFLSVFFSRRLHLFTHRFVRPLLFLAAYALLTSFVGPYPYQHIVFAVKLSFIILIFVNGVYLAMEGLISERWLTMCTWIVLCSMAICIGVGLITGRTPTEYNTPYATAGLMNHVSIASFFILSTLPVFIRAVFVKRLAMVGIATVYVLLFFTMCRSALIAAFLSGCYCFVVRLIPHGSQIPWRKAVVQIGLFLLLVAIGLNTAAGADLITRFKDLNPYDGCGSGRYTFWKMSLEHVTHRSIRAQVWGEGLGAIRNVLKARFGLAIGCHNDWLDFAAAFGVWGLIGIGWWYFELVRLARSLRSRKEGVFQGACASVIILALISAGTGGSLEPPWALTYAALGSWMGCVMRADQFCCTDPSSL